MANVTASTQLDTFSIVRSILASNSTLSPKFKLSDFYEFEPRHKGGKFGGFPYIWIDIPEVEDMEEYLGNKTKNKSFTISVILRMDYHARDNFTTLCSAIISALEGGNSTFIASGYNLQNVSFDGAESIVINEKQVVQGEFLVELQGEVAL